VTADLSGNFEQLRIGCGAVPAPKTRGQPVFATRIAFVIAVFFVSATAAFAGPPPHQGPADPGPDSTKIRIDASCAGDTITGNVSMQAPAGESYRLELFYRGRGRAGWQPTGRTATFAGSGTERTYTYSFDVSSFDAFAYRLDMSGEHAWSQTISAGSCAPGRQVPEAPAALLLPLSLLATAAFLLRVRRSRLF
jgi:hypothetical protein